MMIHKTIFLLKFAILGLIVGLVTLTPWAQAQNLAGPKYKSWPINLNNTADRIVPIDVNNDGLLDLITADKAQLSIYLQQTSEPPFQFDKPSIAFTLPGKATGWDLDWNTALTNGESATTNKAVRIVAIVDGKNVVAWPIENNKLGPEQVLLDNLAGNLPLGAYPLNFVRDINNDQRNDYIVPGADYHSIYLQNPNGQFSGGINIKSNVWIQSLLAIDNELTTEVGQSVRIPEFRIRDVNNDGVKDLISQARNQLEVFLSNKNGTYPSEPSYTYDMDEIRERLGEPDLDNIDFSNLSAFTRYTYTLELQDVTGDKIEDIVIREAGKVVIYAGTPTGMKLDKPYQVLRSSGNVFSAGLIDEDGDGLNDLFLTRVEDVSLGKAFVWLALSGSIDLESFIYRNQGDKFANRPHRKLTVSITFPSLLKSMSLFSDAQERAKEDTVQRTLRASINGQENDLLLLDEQGIRVHLDVLEAATSSENYFLGLIDDIRAKDNFVIDLNELFNNIGVEGQNHLQAAKDKTENIFLKFDNNIDELAIGSDLIALDLNGDHQDDIILFNEREESNITGVLYLSH